MKSIEDRSYPHGHRVLKNFKFGFCKVETIFLSLAEQREEAALHRQVLNLLKVATEESFYKKPLGEHCMDAFLQRDVCILLGFILGG